MHEGVILILAVTNLSVFWLAGHATGRTVVFTGLVALAAVVIALAKQELLFPRPFSQAVQWVFGLPGGSPLAFDRGPLLGWSAIGMCAYLIAVSAF